jgi:hypothetical protein
MQVDHVKDRLQSAMHRGKTKVSEDELEVVAAVVLAVVGEVTVELATLIAELSQRVEALEAKAAN